MKFPKICSIGTLILDSAQNSNFIGSWPPPNTSVTQDWSCWHGMKKKTRTKMVWSTLITSPSYKTSLWTGRSLPQKQVLSEQVNTETNRWFWTRLLNCLSGSCRHLFNCGPQSQHSSFWLDILLDISTDIWNYYFSTRLAALPSKLYNHSINLNNSTQKSFLCEEHS